MNKELAQKVIDSINTTEKYFGMAEFFANVLGDTVLPEDKNDCGTPSCIAGHTISLLEQEQYEYIINKTGHVTMDVARMALDITHTEAHWLFFGYFSYRYLDEIERKEATKAIRYLMEGGDVGGENRWHKVEV